MNARTLDRKIKQLKPEALAELDFLLAAPLSFVEFVTRAMPSFEWYPAQRLMANVLEQVARDQLFQVMIFMPPQEGKSLLVSKLFPAYYLQCHPDRWVGVGSYAFSLAKTFSRAARGYYRDVVTDLSDEAAAVELWETPRGGGLGGRAWRIGHGSAGAPAHRGRPAQGPTGSGVRDHPLGPPRLARLGVEHAAAATERRGHRAYALA